MNKFNELYESLQEGYDADLHKKLKTQSAKDKKNEARKKAVVKDFKDLEKLYTNFATKADNLFNEVSWDLSDELHKHLNGLKDTIKKGKDFASKPDFNRDLNK